MRSLYRKESIMTVIENDVVETPENESRFNLRKITRYTFATVVAVGCVVLIKNKLNGSVDGEVTATVETDKS
jgi:hypothetical protein